MLFVLVEYCNCSAPEPPEPSWRKSSSCRPGPVLNEPGSIESLGARFVLVVRSYYSELTLGVAVVETLKSRPLSGFQAGKSKQNQVTLIIVVNSNSDFKHDSSSVRPAGIL